MPTKAKYPPVTGDAQKLAMHTATVRSDTLVRLSIIGVVGLVVVILSLGFAFRPASELSAYAAVTGPIISGVVFGLTGFIVGRQVRAGK